MKKVGKRLLALIVAALMALSFMTGCGRNEAEESGGTTSQAEQNTTAISQDQENLPLLEYSFAFYDESASLWANNPNDVVTPFVESKFNIKVKEVIVAKDEDFKERLAQWIAADNMPDVICTGEAKYALSTAKEKFAVLDDYVKDMVNYNKYFDQKYWPRYMTDGEKYILPNVTLNLNAPEYTSDPWNPGDDVWGLWAREDILEMCGYKFTPVAEIKANKTDKGLKPTLEDFKIEPAIDTPGAFYEFLKKVKDLNLSVGSKPVIPLSIPSWSQFHIGSMFDWGHWRIDENGDADGYMGLPGAKPFYRMLTKMYQEGLIDKDFIIQKDEQLQEKVASGRVACGMYVPDMNAAMQIMEQSNPKATVRYISWPKETPGKGYFDIYQGGGWSYIISNKVKDLKRLTQYFDWFYSDEGLDIITWGPESAGLWEIKEGKKVFKDKEVENDCLNGVHGKKGADFYGLYDYTSSRNPFWSKAAMATPVMTHGNPKDYARSYPPKLNILSVNKALCGSSGVDYNGKAAADDGKENSLAVSNYFWGNFQNIEVAQLLVCETDEEFDMAWDKMYQIFLSEGRYEAAKADMTKWFEANGAK